MSKLKHYRKLAGLTQEELAALAGLGSGAVLSNYEAGRRTPDIHTLKALCDAIRSRKVKVTLEELIDAKQDASAA